MASGSGDLTSKEDAGRERVQGEMEEHGQVGTSSGLTAQEVGPARQWMLRELQVLQEVAQYGREDVETKAVTALCKC